jgi:hypothetical protein
VKEPFFHGGEILTKKHSCAMINCFTDLTWEHSLHPSKKKHTMFLEEKQEGRGEKLSTLPRVSILSAGAVL